MVSPIAFAVCKFMINSNLVGCSSGISGGINGQVIELAYRLKYVFARGKKSLTCVPGRPNKP
jgi:hypothetical protein